MTKRPPRVDAAQIGPMKLEQELDDIDTMSETITNVFHQSVPRVAKAISKPLK